MSLEAHRCDSRAPTLHIHRVTRSQSNNCVDYTDQNPLAPSRASRVRSGKCCFSYAEVCAIHEALSAKGIPCEHTDLYALMKILKTSCADEDLAGLGTLLGKETSWKHLAARALRLARRVFSVQIVNENYRFEWYNPIFPECTAKVDGTPIRVEGPMDALANFKYKYKCVKYEVWVSMDGLAFASKGWRLPATHDAKMFREFGLPFEHVKDEVFLADKGYIGCAHCLHEFKHKKRLQRDDDIPFCESLTNDLIRKPRAYVEHYFADLKKKYKVFDHCRRHYDFISMALKFHIDVNYILVQVGLRTPKYRHVCIRRPQGVPRPFVKCTCDNDSEEYSRRVAYALEVRT